MEKARKLIDYSKLPKNLKQLLRAQYPNGYDEALTRVEVPTRNTSFLSLILENHDTRFMIRFKKPKGGINELFKENEASEVEVDNEIND
jgi:hypothetical protein